MQEAAILEIQQLRLLMGSDRDPLGRVFAQLADALRRSGELDEAHEVARRGVENDPTFTPGHVVLGWVEQDRGEMDAALRCFNRTLELDPENVFGLFGAGSLLDARGDTEGQVLVSRARDLMPGVERTAPRAVLAPLSDLPFISLADLAPDGDAGSAGGGVADPQAAVTMAGDDAVEDGLENLPFLSLAELAPDATEALDALPFVSLQDLAPASPETADDAPAIDAALPIDDAAQDDTLQVDDALQDDALQVDHARDEIDAALEAGVALEADVAEDRDDGVGEVSHPGDGFSADGAEDDADGDDEFGDATPVTRTMAEILVGQGLVDRAIDVYRQLLEASPDSPALRERLSELEARAAGDGAGAGVEDGAAPSAEGPQGTPPETPSGTSPEKASETPPEASPGQTSAGAYFGTLLSWGEPAGRSNRIEQGGDGDDGGAGRG